LTFVRVKIKLRKGFAHVGQYCCHDFLKSDYKKYIVIKYLS